MALLDGLDILRLMPQRYPMLLVDRVQVTDDVQSCIAYKNITLNEPCYQYVANATERAVLAYPLALSAESFGQGAGILLAAHGMLKSGQKDSVVVFGEFSLIERVADAYPGDVLEHRIQIDFASEQMAVLKGSTEVDDRVITHYQGVKVFCINPQVLTRIGVSDE
jgi:3-hydroxymyristoyl/3-hydroxydecanoyl-(acyl carrier protein) dehydratase